MLLKTAVRSVVSADGGVRILSPVAFPSIAGRRSSGSTRLGAQLIFDRLQEANPDTLAGVSGTAQWANAPRSRQGGVWSSPLAFVGRLVSLSACGKESEQSRWRSGPSARPRARRSRGSIPGRVRQRTGSAVRSWALLASYGWPRAGRARLRDTTGTALERNGSRSTRSPSSWTRQIGFGKLWPEAERSCALLRRATMLRTPCEDAQRGPTTREE